MRHGWVKPKEIRLQRVSELSKADVYVSQFRWQIVPDSGSGNRKVSVAETVLCSWDNACSVVGWSKETPSAVSKKLDIIGQVLGREGADHVVTWTWCRKVWTALVDRLVGVMCSCRLAPVISRAAAFWTDCTFRIKLSECLWCQSGWWVDWSPATWPVSMLDSIVACWQTSKRSYRQYTQWMSEWLLWCCRH